MSGLAFRPGSRPGGNPRRRRRARWVWAAGLAGAAVVLFVAYLRMSGTYAATSDGADQALQGWDMLHGNWLLHGWTLGDVTYYTTEIPQYALVEVFRGLGADVVHIAGAVTYTLLVLAVGLLARGRATGREGLVRLAVGAGIMLAPQFGNATHLLLSQPDHLGTQLPLLLVFLMLDRAPRRWYVPVAAGAALAWVIVADRVALLTAVVPLAVVCGARVLLAVLRRRRSLASQWYELSLVAASALSYAAAEVAVRLISALGGYRVTPVASATLAHLHTFPRRFVVAFEGILNMYGGDFFHISENSPFGPGLGGLPRPPGSRSPRCTWPAWPWRCGASSARSGISSTPATWFPRPGHGDRRQRRRLFGQHRLIRAVRRPGDPRRAALRRRPGRTHGPCRLAGVPRRLKPVLACASAGVLACYLAGLGVRRRPAPGAGQRAGGHSLAGRRTTSPAGWAPTPRRTCSPSTAGAASRSGT